MSTPSYGESDPLTTTASTTDHTSTPIADALAQDTPPPAPPMPPAPSSGSDDSSSGAADAAKEKAQDVKDMAQDAVGSVSQHGSDVADTAKEEVTKVAAEAKDKAADLLSDVKSQVDEQSRTQLSNLAAKLGELGDEIQSMLRGEQTSGTANTVAQQLADKTQALSSHLESREPLDLLEDVRGFARRRPAAFLAGAAVAGVLAGRMTRGAKASQDSSPSTPAAPLTSPVASDPPSFAPAPPTPTTDFAGGFADEIPDGQNTGGRQ